MTTRPPTGNTPGGINGSQGVSDGSHIWNGSGPRNAGATPHRALDESILERLAADPYGLLGKVLAAGGQGESAGRSRQSGSESGHSYHRDSIQRPGPDYAAAVPPQLSDLQTGDSMTDVGSASPTATGVQPYLAVSEAPSFYFIDERPADPGLVLGSPPSQPAFDVESVRRDFPILAERVNGGQLIWLDNAATTQKPQAVIDRLTHYYSHENSNVHRGAHALAARATDAYEDARCSIAGYIGAALPESVIFTRGTTEGINLVAQTWGHKHVRPGDEIVVSHLEHHANIVPWQQLVQKAGATLRVIPVDDDGQLDLARFEALLGARTRLVAIAHVSNVLGTVVPVREIIEASHHAGARVLVDGAQAAAHVPVDVRALDVDFYAFSGHKVYGPTGIGALYAKPEILEETPPWQGGGNMIKDVTFERTLYQSSPTKFEAGTGSIADAIGLAAALSYVSCLGLSDIVSYERHLLDYAAGQMSSVPGLRLIGTAPHKASTLTFVLRGHRPEAIGAALDRQGIAVRAGHHCAQPILRRYGLEAAVRPSLAMYNTRAEIDALVHALRHLS